MIGCSKPHLSLMESGQRTVNAEWARSDPNGFYHGMIVQHGGHHFVMQGPPAAFVPGQVSQPGLFGDG